MASKYRQVTKTWVVCPKCDSNVSTIDHLIGGRDTSWGPWYCDKCGQGVTGEIKNGEIIVNDDNKHSLELVVTLLYRDGLVFFVEGNYYSMWDEDERYDLRYLYEEQQCPQNFLGKVFKVYDIEEDDIDPHGLFKYIYTHPIPREDVDRVQRMSCEELSEYLNIDIPRIKDVVEAPIRRSSINGMYFGEPIWKDWVKELRLKKE